MLNYLKNLLIENRDPDLNFMIEKIDMLENAKSDLSFASSILQEKDINEIYYIFDPTEICKLTPLQVIDVAVSVSLNKNCKEYIKKIILHYIKRVLKLNDCSNKSFTIEDFKYFLNLSTVILDVNFIEAIFKNYELSDYFPISEMVLYLVSCISGHNKTSDYMLSNIFKGFSHFFELSKIKIANEILDFIFSDFATEEIRNVRRDIIDTTIAYCVDSSALINDVISFVIKYHKADPIFAKCENFISLITKLYENPQCSSSTKKNISKIFYENENLKYKFIMYLNVHSCSNPTFACHIIEQIYDKNEEQENKPILETLFKVMTCYYHDIVYILLNEVLLKTLEEFLRRSFYDKQYCVKYEADIIITFKVFTFYPSLRYLSYYLLENSDCTLRKDQITQNRILETFVKMFDQSENEIYDLLTLNISPFFNLPFYLSFASNLFEVAFNKNILPTDVFNKLKITKIIRATTIYAKFLEHLIYENATIEDNSNSLNYRSNLLMIEMYYQLRSKEP